jgi:NAD(P)H-dependent flavin oxidoreductase YrpB (nitropropane dioxygenase family)
VISRAHSGKTVRMLRNRFTEYWQANEDRILKYPHQLKEVGEPASVRGRIDGDVDNGVLPAGQSVALIHEVEPAGRIVQRIVAEAREAFERSFGARSTA